MATIKSLVEMNLSLVFGERNLISKELYLDESKSAGLI